MTGTIFAPGSKQGAEAMQVAAVKGRSLWDDATRRLMRNRAAVVSIVVLAIIALMALFAPLLSAYPYDAIDYNVIAMQAILRRLGIPSDVVGDGVAALAQLQRARYDVAFLDWSLPGLSGTEVAARFRAVEPPTQRTILIATTAHSSEANREACLRAGMDAFIAKPITPDKIAAALRELGASVASAGKIEVDGGSPTADAEIDLGMIAFLASESPDGLRGQIEAFLASFETDRAATRRAVRDRNRPEISR